MLLRAATEATVAAAEEEEDAQRVEPVLGPSRRRFAEATRWLEWQAREEEEEARE
jgi:hypothetical protein